MAINQANLFNNVPDEKIYMNEYDLSFDNIITTEIGRITPIFCRRVLPGEKWKMFYDCFVRTMPLLAPVYGKMDLYVHAFYCTNRSLSNIWEQYIKAGDDGETEYEPDLLTVYNSSYNLDLREVLTLDHIDAVVNSMVTGFGGFTEYIEAANQDKSLRFPFTHGSLTDYLGIGSVISTSRLFLDEKFPKDVYMRPFKYSLLPFKAYQSIWSEYYADANVQTFDGVLSKNGDEIIDWRFLQPLNQVAIYPTGDDPQLSFVDTLGNDILPVQSNEATLKNLFTLRRRCFSKDYFTSSLPEPQRGPDVLIPVDAEIEVLNNKSDNTATEFGTLGSTGSLLDGFVGFDDNNSNKSRILKVGTASQQDVTQTEVLFNEGASLQVFNANQLRAEISSLSATITDLRTAIALQEFYESSARYGNRYKEFVYGHFGSMIPDDQLTRPWYLGGLKIPIQISDVMQTANDANSNTGVGNLYGKGLSATNENNFLFDRQFDDYGLIMVLLSIRPHNYYKNTIQKEWIINDRLDEYWRKLQGVGEDEVFNYELQGFFGSEGSLVHSDDVFGYQMRFSNYKFSNDEVHGDFKGDLSYWTMCRDFYNGVTLSPNFLEVHPIEFNHIFQYEGLDTDHFLINGHFGITREAPMDIYSIPRIN